MMDVLVYLVQLFGGSMLMTLVTALGLVVLACIAVLRHCWVEMSHYNVSEPWQ